MSCRYFVFCYENERLDEIKEFFGELEARNFENNYNKPVENEDFLESHRAALRIVTDNEEEEFLSSNNKAPKTPSLDIFTEIKEKAIKFAIDKHEGQLYGNLPYITHLNHVYETAKRLGVDPNKSKIYQEILIACLLHDTIEDTDTTFEDLEKMF